MDMALFSDGFIMLAAFLFVKDIFYLVGSLLIALGILFLWIITVVIKIHSTEEIKSQDNYGLEAEILRKRLFELINTTVAIGSNIQQGDNNYMNVDNDELFTLVQNCFGHLKGELESAKVMLEKVSQNMETLQVEDSKKAEVLTTIRKEVRYMLESGVVPTFRSLFETISKFIGNQELETFQLSDMDQQDQTLINIIAKRYGMVDIDQLRQSLEVPNTVVQTALENKDRKEFFCKVLFWILKENKSQEDYIATFKEFDSRMPEKKKNTSTCVTADDNSSLSMEHTDTISHESSIDLTAQSNSVFGKKLDAMHDDVKKMASQMQQQMMQEDYETKLKARNTLDGMSLDNLNLPDEIKQHQTEEQQYILDKAAPNRMDYSRLMEARNTLDGMSLDNLNLPDEIKQHQTEEQQYILDKAAPNRKDYSRLMEMERRKPKMRGDAELD